MSVDIYARARDENIALHFSKKISIFGKNNCMNATLKIKERLHRYVDEADDSFLEIVHAMFDKYRQQQVAGYEADGTPISYEELKDQCDQAAEDIENGNYHTIEEIRKEMKEW